MYVVDVIPNGAKIFFSMNAPSVHLLSRSTLRVPSLNVRLRSEELEQLTIRPAQVLVQANQISQYQFIASGSTGAGV